MLCVWIAIGVVVVIVYIVVGVYVIVVDVFVVFVVVAVVTSHHASLRAHWGSSGSLRKPADEKDGE